MWGCSGWVVSGLTVSFIKRLEVYFYLYFFLLRAVPLDHLLNLEWLMLLFLCSLTYYINELVLLKMYRIY